ncbi:MAG TPA: CPBP family intramembrane glutamic endopeptidase [Rhodanobacteraceae bacterium]|nr:CPBP family intramembrane glutamic endopeptidase [Rhodanobacteraceae bacterium]
MDSPVQVPEPASPASTIPPPGRPGIWSGLGVVALYFALQLGFGLLVGIAIGFYSAFKAGWVTGLWHATPLAHAAIHALMTHPDVAATSAVVTIAGAVVVTWLLVRRFWPAQWRVADPPGFGLVRAHAHGDYPIAVLLGIAVVLIGGALRHLLAHGHPVPQNVGVLFGSADTTLRVLLALVAIVVAPLGEELIFRGALLSGFMRRMPAAWAVLATAVIFGCAHLPDFKFAWYAIPSLVIVGIALGWMRLYAHSLWPAVVLHATNNAIAVFAWFVIVHR